MALPMSNAAARLDLRVEWIFMATISPISKDMRREAAKPAIAGNAPGRNAAAITRAPVQLDTCEILKSNA
jgi:hypothetical protein